MRNYRLLALGGILALLLAACGPAATPTPTKAPATPIPVTTPTPGATPPPGVTPTPTPKPTPTAAPVGPKTGGVARFPWVDDPTSWDPSRTHVAAINNIRGSVFTKLFTQWSDNPQNCRAEVYPWGVQSWRWVDDTTAEFTLRAGMKYHNKPPVNGREAVAQDMVPAFERYRKNLAQMASKSVAVEAVTVQDKYTFRMRLKFPWGGMVPELMGHMYGPWLEPAEAGGTDGRLWEQPEKSWIGSGAFMFDSWRPGVKWRLVRNPDYWVKGRPYLEAVEIMVIPDASTQLAALRARQVSLLEDFPEDLLDEASRAIPGLQVARCPANVFVGFSVLWMNNSGPPFNDVRVRRAVAMAIDRQAIIDTLYKGRASAFPVLPPPTRYALSLEEFPPEVRPFLKYDPTMAKRLLAEAGYPNGFDTVLNFTRAYKAPASMVAEAVTGMLSAVGIRAKINMIEYSRYITTVLRAIYPVGEVAGSPGSMSTPEDSHALFSFWSKAGGVNRSLVNDPEYDKLFQEFQATRDEKRRTELARQLQVMIATQAYRVGMPFGMSTLAALPATHFTWVGNYKDFHMLFETMWVE